MIIDMTAMRPETEVAVIRIFLAARVVRSLAAVGFFMFMFGLFDISTPWLSTPLAVGLVPLSWCVGRALYWISAILLAQFALSQLSGGLDKRNTAIQETSGRRAFGKLDLLIQRYRVRKIWVWAVSLACLDHFASGSFLIPFIVALIGLIVELYYTTRFVTVPAQTT